MVGNAAAGFLADEFGWRTAFLALGAPGVLLAILLRFTVREPARGATEKTPVQDQTESLAVVMRFLLGMPAYRHLLIAAAIHYFAHFGAGMWIPTFLARTRRLWGGMPE